jgi:hypothetical protein
VWCPNQPCRNEAANRNADEKAGGKKMTSEGGRFYLIYRDLLQLANGADVGAVSLEEMDEIDQIRKLVVEVTTDPPQFCTST